MYVQRNSEPRSCIHFCSGKAISITCSECVFVVLGIHHECAYAVLSSVACPILSYFSTISHKRHDFRENGTEHKMYVLILTTTFVRNISRSKKNIPKYVELI